jgi:hypothetical protein
MIEAGTPSTKEVALVHSEVLAPPGMGMIAPPEVPRNASEARAQSEGRARQVERRGQGHYRGRSPCVRMYGAPATSAGTPRRLRAQEPRPGRLYSDTRLAGRKGR